MRSLLLAFFMVTSSCLFAQRYSVMPPNRYSFTTVGGGFPYAGIKTAFEVREHVFIEVQAFTDGGNLWRTDRYNDWRSLSILRALPLEPLHSEFRVGVGIVQSEERLLNQSANSFGVAPQIGYTLFIHPKCGLSSSITWPLSRAKRLTPGVLIGLEYRIGRYVKENGLH